VPHSCASFAERMGSENAASTNPGIPHPSQYYLRHSPRPPIRNESGQEHGGNGDGIIDQRDAIYSHLLLWIDENHDGISQPNELHTLLELGVFSLGLRYKELRQTDRYGNLFHYRGVVNPDPNGESNDGRWSYDVFFVLSDERGKLQFSKPKGTNPFRAIPGNK
jgi:hypothetical protein